jgi:hypothetical protein
MTQMYSPESCFEIVSNFNDRPLFSVIGRTICSPSFLQSITEVEYNLLSDF